MKKLLLLIVLLVSALSASAQTDEFRAAYDSFRNQARKDYEDFRQRANAEYAEWVKKAWRGLYDSLGTVFKHADEHEG